MFGCVCVEGDDVCVWRVVMCVCVEGRDVCVWRGMMCVCGGGDVCVE